MDKQAENHSEGRRKTGDRRSRFPYYFGAPWFAPAILSLLLLLTFGALLWFIQSNVEKSRRARLISAAESAAESIRQRLNGNRDYLLLLAHQKASGKMESGEFHQRVLPYVKDHPELINITWVDARRIVRDVVPFNQNRQIIGLKLDLPEPKQASTIAMKTRSPVYTRPFEAIQGNPSFEIWTPVFRNNQFIGLFAGVYSCAKLLEHAIPKHLARQNQIVMLNSAGGVLAELPTTGAINSKMTHSIEISPPGKEIFLRLQQYRNGAWELKLALLSIICTILIICTAYAMWRLKKELAENKRSDIELKKNQETLQSLNRALKTLSRCNETLVRAKDEKELLNSICRIIVDMGGYRMAWAGFAEEDEEKSVRPVAEAGYAEGYLEKVRISWGDNEYGHGPTGKAIRTGKAAICTDMLNDPAYAAWRSQAIEQGYASSISLPLMGNGHAFGALNIYASEAEAFNKEEVDLLAELAEDLSYGIKTLRMREDNRRAHIYLQESEERYHSLFENSPDGIILSRADGGVIAANPAACGMLGMTEAEVLQAGRAGLVDPDDKRAPKLLNERAMTGKYKGVMNHIRKNGVKFPAEVTSSSFRNSRGEVLASVFLRDITERRRIEEAQARLTAILETTTDLVATADMDGKLTYMNRAGRKMLGLGEDEDISRINIPDLHPGWATESIMNGGINTAIETGAWSGETAIINRNGSEIPVLQVILAHRSDEGALAYFSTTMRDITGIKQSESEIKKLNEELEGRVEQRTAQLEAANKELESFSYSVSHDLSAPLRHIKGFSQALLEECGGALNSDCAGYLQRVMKSSERMEHLIEDILSLSRISRGDLNIRAVDLRDMAQEIAADLQHNEPKRRAVFKIDQMQGFGDPRLLRIVLENLMGNAWKFTGKREESAIELGAAEIDGETTYFVRDNGAGFDMQYAGKLFAPFQRLHDAGEFPGNGIGLATVQRIIHRHGGCIWAESEIDKGATIYFTLPGKGLEDYHLPG